MCEPACKPPQIISRRFGRLTTTVIELDGVIYIEFQWHGEKISMNSKTMKIKRRPIPQSPSGTN